MERQMKVSTGGGSHYYITFDRTKNHITIVCEYDEIILNYQEAIIFQEHLNQEMGSWKEEKEEIERKYYDSEIGRK